MTRHITRVPAVRRSHLDLGAHGCVPFLLADDAALVSWVELEPSPRFLWRAIAPTTAYSYRLEPRGYYAPMNCYRQGFDRVLKRVALVVEGAR
jgi:hypothetical protein